MILEWAEPASSACGEEALKLMRWEGSGEGAEEAITFSLPGPSGKISIS